MLREAGLPSSVLDGGLDHAMADAIARHLAGAGLDAVLLLAQDLPYDERGEPLASRAGFHVPNDRLLDLCAASAGRFIPAVSIHPYRRDALRELDRCAARGAKALKLLPNCHNADCNAPRTREFWKRMAELRLVFLAHTGGEMSVPVLNRAYESPEILRLPLECGVTCIAAHGAGASAPGIGRDHTERLAAMFREYPHLWCDNSALATPNRARTARRLLREDMVGRVLHGSDFPIPSGGLGPLLHGLVGPRDFIATARDPNPLRRDAALKRAMGFPDDTFTRLAGLLAP